MSLKRCEITDTTLPAPHLPHPYVSVSEILCYATWQWGARTAPHRCAPRRTAAHPRTVRAPCCDSSAYCRIPASQAISSANLDLVNKFVWVGDAFISQQITNVYQFASTFGPTCGELVGWWVRYASSVGLGCYKWYQGATRPEVYRHCQGFVS